MAEIAKCRCGHALSYHCKMGTQHSGYKDQARMVKNPEMTTCATRHCLEPLCDCVDFNEAAVVQGFHREAVKDDTKYVRS